MAGGTILLAVIVSLVDAAYVIPLHATIQIISNSTRVLLFLKHVKWKIIGLFVIGIIPGALIGINIFRLLNKDVIKLLMGIFILVITYLPKRKDETRISYSVFIPVGLISGLIGIFFGAIGPFIAPFFIRKDVLKEELIATKATCQAITHVIKIPLFGFIGINVFSYWQDLLFLCSAVVVGTVIGKNVLRGMSEVSFARLFKIILTILALRIIITQSMTLLNV